MSWPRPNGCGVKEEFAVSADDKTRITVDIYGMQYKLAGHSSSGHMRRVAQYVDEQMHLIAKGFPKLDTQRVAVLTAVNLADQYLRLSDEREKQQINLQSSMSEAHEALLEEHGKLQEEYNAALAKLSEAKSREAELQEQLEKLQEEYSKLQNEYNEWIQLNLESER